MNIMVFNVPAESVGALSILDDLINDLSSFPSTTEWIFVLGKPVLKVESSNIHILRYPWIKKNWLYRIFFDLVKAPLLIRKKNPDVIVSFQNITIPFTNKKQILYIHNSIPFSNLKFSFLKEPKLWIYKNIMGLLIKNSIKKSTKVIVQSKWMESIILDKVKIEKKKIEVINPSIKSRKDLIFKSHANVFFYPASAFDYKNHQLIIDACKILLERKITEFEVIFTINKNDNEYALDIFKEIKKNNLPIKLIGTVSREEVFEYYSKTVLLFPSLIETYGLPLAEARAQECIILGGNMPFTNELLKNYSNFYSFNVKESKELSELMKLVIYNKISKKTPKSLPNIKSKNIIDAIIN